MCGIAGWIGRPDSSPEHSINAMIQAIRHRGPDGEGVFHTSTRDGGYRIALGHRRLAIIDLVAGLQPMRTEDGSLSIVFNGEIYNFVALREELKRMGHAFATASDTEVLLEAYRAWGVDCLKRLRGMFAFALWDSEREQLFIARDRFGKKPLFYWQDDRRFVFASEIKSLLAHPAIHPALDRQSVFDYLQYRYVPGPHTLFQGIQKLDPGSYTLWREGQWRTESFYTPPDAMQRPDADPGDDKAIQLFLDKLDESVQLRMVSDVPFGAFLSGGLDSSALVALMSRHSSLPINSFTVGFEESEYSEVRYARLIADKYKTSHHEMIIKADDIITHLPEAIAFHDAPMGEPTDIATLLLSREAAKSVKMVLLGEGADEILGGYRKYRFEPYAALYHAIIPDALRKLLSPLVDRLPYRYYRQQTLITSLGLTESEDRLPRWFGALDERQRERLSALDIAPRPVSERPFRTAPGQSALRRIQYFDQTSWLPDNLLERGDRMTMGASIEGRMPFMDHELAGLIARLPDRYRQRRGVQKWILRQAMAPYLPNETLARRKVGFRVPINLWFQTSLKGALQEQLLGSGSLTRDFYRRDRLTRILEEHSSGRQNHEKLIWALWNLELFQQHYRLA